MSTPARGHYCQGGRRRYGHQCHQKLKHGRKYRTSRSDFHIHERAALSVIIAMAVAAGTVITVIAVAAATVVTFMAVAASTCLLRSIHLHMRNEITHENSNIA